MTNRSWTPASGVLLSVPLLLRKNLKRASRAGPSGGMNEGILLGPPATLAARNSGFMPIFGNTEALGLDPPSAGWEWQDTHESLLKRGPRPLSSPPEATSTSLNRSRPSLKYSLG